MDSTYCSKIEKCPIFQKGILFGEATQKSYKQYYCLNEDRYKECKRYIVSEISGLTVPESIMPNTKMSIEEIIEKIKTDKLI